MKSTISDTKNLEIALVQSKKDRIFFLACFSAAIVLMFVKALFFKETGDTPLERVFTLFFCWLFVTTLSLIYLVIIDYRLINALLSNLKKARQ